jgi:hypothetical protein
MLPGEAHGRREGRGRFTSVRREASRRRRLRAGRFKTSRAQRELCGSRLARYLSEAWKYSTGVRKYSTGVKKFLTDVRKCLHPARKTTSLVRKSSAVVKKFSPAAKKSLTGAGKLFPRVKKSSRGVRKCLRDACEYSLWAQGYSFYRETLRFCPCVSRFGGVKRPKGRVSAQQKR